MTTREISEELQVHYQTTSRVARALYRERGLGVIPHNTSFDAETTEVIRQRVLDIKRGRKGALKPSTAAQRRAWFKTWSEALRSATGPLWGYIACVLGLIEFTRDPVWLQSELDDGTVGGRILWLVGVDEVDHETGLSTGLTAWLLDAGFIPNTPAES